MWIEGLELKNIKSYEHAEISFNKGINFICGGNGAGKTTIIECVGLALFNYAPVRSLNEYMIRYGCKYGLIALKYNVDGKRFRAERRIGPGYYWRLYEDDMLLDLHGTEDVEASLSEQLGIKGSLQRTFSDIIGVSQGMFTTPFLMQPADRKRLFNKIFMLEEYALSADRARNVRRYIEGLLKDVELRAVVLDEKLNGYDTALKEYETLLALATEDEKALRGALAALDESTAMLESKKAKRGALVSKQTDLNGKISALRAALEEQKTALYEQEQESVREKSALESESKRVDEWLRKALNEYEITALELNRHEESRGVLDATKAFVENIRGVSLHVTKGAELWLENEAMLKKCRLELESAPELQKKLERHKALEAMKLEREKLLAAMGAKLKSLELDIARAKDGNCPYTGVNCTMIEGGLHEFLSAKLDDVVSVAAAHKRKLGNISSELAALGGIRQEQASLESTRTALGSANATQKKLFDGFLSYHKRLMALNVPHDEAWDNVRKIFEAQNGMLPGDGGASPEHYASSLDKLAVLASDTEKRCRAAFDGKLKSLNEAHKRAMSEASDAKNSAVNLSARREKLEDTLRSIEKKRYTIKQNGSNLAELLIQSDALEKELKTLDLMSGDNSAPGVSMDELEALTLQQRETAIRLEEVLKQRRQKLLESQKTIEDMKRWKIDRERLSLDENESKQDENLLSAISGILKGAGERIAATYRANLATRANEIYGNIFHGSEGLVWTEDYDITLHNHSGGQGKTRMFRQLSGGEQMAAALSVRLAMLEGLGNVGIGFFDEPTINLDTEKRVNLADIFPKLLTEMEQSFIISHDDTFDAIAESVIRIEKEGGKSLAVYK